MMPMTKDPERRREVMLALLRAKESGLLGLLAHAWVGHRNLPGTAPPKDEATGEFR